MKGTITWLDPAKIGLPPLTEHNTEDDQDNWFSENLLISDAEKNISIGYLVYYNDGANKIIGCGCNDLDSPIDLDSIVRYAYINKNVV